jgi:hypothetical protein
MKHHASQAWMVGPVKEMQAVHTDGAPLTITMQVGLAVWLPGCPAQRAGCQGAEPSDQLLTRLLRVHPLRCRRWAARCPRAWPR